MYTGRDGEFMLRYREKVGEKKKGPDDKQSNAISDRGQSGKSPNPSSQIVDIHPMCCRCDSGTC